MKVLTRELDAFDAAMIALERVGKPNDEIALMRSPFAMSIVHRSGGGGWFIRAAPQPAAGDEILLACRCSRSHPTCR
jgi:hypothetical protein